MTSDKFQEYYTALTFHDWYYQYSDCHRVWEAGQNAMDKLRQMQKELDPDFSIWNQYAPTDCKVDYRGQDAKWKEIAAP